jgi:hypothetical protein
LNRSGKMSKATVTPQQHQKNIKELEDIVSKPPNDRCADCNDKGIVKIENSLCVFAERNGIDLCEKKKKKKKKKIEKKKKKKKKKKTL